jgi:glycosyltransferase involved in cell wall biosynthesis
MNARTGSNVPREARVDATMRSHATVEPRTSVSIVITCYNYARYVRLAIDSALAQTWPQVEVVVVDDGSTDGSAEVIASYGERIRAVHQRNQGHVAAFNHGFVVSTGSIVIFLDADDLLYPEAARSAVEGWRPGCCKLQYNLDVIGSEGESFDRRCCSFPARYDAAAIRDEFRRCNTYTWPVSSGNAYARSYLERTLPLTVRLAPDGLLNTLAPLFGDVVTLHRSLGCYRIHQANQSYHGAGTAGVEERFVKQIALRRSEQRALSTVAAQRGVALARVDLLDHELVFINYRLMMRKLGARYEGSDADSVSALWTLGLAFLARRPLALRVRLQNLVWLSVLALAPAVIARRLVMLRFNRGDVLRPVRQAGATLRGLLHRTR